MRFSNALPQEVNGLLSIGSSGCAIGSALMVLNDRLRTHVCIRKSGEKAHSDYPTGTYDGTVYAIVDDFIDTGNTIFGLLERARTDRLNVKYVLVSHCYFDDKEPEIRNRIESYGAKLIFPSGPGRKK